MHPTAIIFVFSFLALAIIAGLILIIKSGQGFRCFFRSKFTFHREIVTGLLLWTSIGTLGILLTVFAARGVYRLLWTG